jgi:hypothetical protein
MSRVVGPLNICRDAVAVRNLHTLLLGPVPHRFQLLSIAGYSSAPTASPAAVAAAGFARSAHKWS